MMPEVFSVSILEGGDAGCTCMLSFPCSTGLNLMLDAVCRCLELTRNNMKYTLIAWITGAHTESDTWPAASHSVLGYDISMSRALVRILRSSTAREGVGIHRLVKQAFMLLLIRDASHRVTGYLARDQATLRVIRLRHAGWLNVLGQFATTGTLGYITVKHLGVMWMLANGHVFSNSETFLGYASGCSRRL